MWRKLKQELEDKEERPVCAKKEHGVSHFKKEKESQKEICQGSGVQKKKNGLKELGDKYRPGVIFV